jgi:predicted DCC family thiol-disulfide oxidoreductase YuxK
VASGHRHRSTGTSLSLSSRLAVANIALILFALAGAFTRYTLGLATILSVYVFGLMQNQGKVDHTHHIVWFMALLAIGPSGHLLSLDAIVRAARRADRGIVEPEVPGVAALWTLRYTWALFGLLFIVPGLAKLWSVVHANWASAENLRHLMWVRWFELSLYQPGFMLPLRVDHLPSWILEAFGWGAILFELGFVVLVLLRPTRGLAALGCIAFLDLSAFALRIFFRSLAVALVSLVDWSALGRSYAELRGRKPLLILYDGECQLCRRTVAILGTMDVWRALEPVAGLSGDPRRRQQAELTDDMLTRDMYVLREGQPLRGYDGYVAIAERIAMLWPLSFVMKLPPVAAVGRIVYRRVADARQCSIVPHPPATVSMGHPRASWVHRVGASLIIAQTFFSFTNFAAGMRLSFLPKAVRTSVNALQAEYSSMRLAWPFDTYPTFAAVWPGSIEVWEARVVFADGRERRVTAGPYAAFCTPAQCSEITRGALAERDPIRQRKLSMELVRQLWRYETPRNGADAVGMRVYHARYSLDPSTTRLLEQRLVHEFPSPLISSPPTQ